MLKVDDVVNVFRNSSTYEGLVVGTDAEYFWLVIMDLGEVQRGHQDNIFEHNGKTYLVGPAEHATRCSITTFG